MDLEDWNKQIIYFQKALFQQNFDKAVFEIESFCSEIAAITVMIWTIPTNINHKITVTEQQSSLTI